MSDERISALGWDKPIFSVSQITQLARTAKSDLQQGKEDDGVNNDNSDVALDESQDDVRYDELTVNFAIRSIIKNGIEALIKNQFLLKVADAHRSGKKQYIYRSGKKSAPFKFGAFPYKRKDSVAVFRKYEGYPVSWWYLKDEQNKPSNNPYQKVDGPRRKYKMTISDALNRGFLTADYVDDGALILLDTVDQPIGDTFQLEV